MPVVPPHPQTPLAAQLRPYKLDEVIGQTHLLGEGKPIRKMAQKRRAQSTILWGPPGTGKTSLVRALAREVDATFWAVNATNATVKELREIILAANSSKPRLTFVFVDEIHRFSKSQQDVLLPVVEDGTIILFGATTEKAAFAVNSTILSRCLVLETRPLNPQEMIDLIKRVKAHYKAKDQPVKIDQDAAKLLITRCSGDARKLITTLETCIEILSDDRHITVEHVHQAIPTKHLVFDANGNEHFDLAHAYQEAIQNSDTDAALYWLGKWIESGEEPAYICRRMLITAFEDCAGNPFAWLAAMAASYTAERTGLPECAIPMALATAEMGKSKRNKAAYTAIGEVFKDIAGKETVHVPPDLRAGTAGYVHAIKKRYLKKWEKDVPGLNFTADKKTEQSWGDRKKDEYDGQVVYAAGHKGEAPNDYGMYAGPTPHLDQLLADVGEDGDVIFEFYPKGDGERADRHLYHWKNEKWELA